MRILTLLTPLVVAFVTGNAAAQIRADIPIYNFGLAEEEEELKQNPCVTSSSADFETGHLQWSDGAYWTIDKSTGARRAIDLPILVPPRKGENPTALGPDCRAPMKAQIGRQVEIPTVDLPASVQPAPENPETQPQQIR